MFVKIKEDAKSVNTYDGHTVGSWVEEYRGQVFKVTDGKYSTWIVTSGNKTGIGIDASQADPLVPSPTIRFNDEITLQSGMTAEYQVGNDLPVIVLLVASGDKLKTVKIGDNDAYGSYNFTLTPESVNKIWGLADGSRITFQLDGQPKIHGQLIWEKEAPKNKFSSSNGELVINKAGSVALNGLKIMRSQVEEVFKVLNFDLAQSVEVPVGCKAFTIKEIKEFKIFYEKYLSSLDK